MTFCNCSTSVTQGAPLRCRSVNTSSYATAFEHIFFRGEAEGGVRRRSGLSSCYDMNELGSPPPFFFFNFFFLNVECEKCFKETPVNLWPEGWASTATGHQIPNQWECGEAKEQGCGKGCERGGSAAQSQNARCGVGGVQLGRAGGPLKPPAPPLGSILLLHQPLPWFSATDSQCQGGTTPTCLGAQSDPPLILEQTYLLSLSQ